jgi:hypothetical protein
VSSEELDHFYQQLIRVKESKEATEEVPDLSGQEL